MVNQTTVNSEEFTRYAICKHMGWDYYTFEKQPPFFIEEILIFMMQENNKQKIDTNRVSEISKPKGYSRG